MPLRETGAAFLKRGPESKLARIVTLIAEASDAGKRISTVLRNRLGAGTTLQKQLKKDPRAVLCNGSPVYLNQYISPGDRLCVRLPESADENYRQDNVAPHLLPVETVWEDRDYIVFDKPAGTPVHPSRAHVHDTLANHYRALYPGHIFFPLTRLDFDTSGLVLAAKNKLAASIDRGGLTRIYYGVTDRPVAENGGVCCAPLAREQEGRPRRTVRPDGQQAVTHWRKISTGNGRTLLRFRLETGRTHQIRAHCAYMGFPLMGDTLYGGTAGEISRQALHAAYLTFQNPLTGQKVTVKSSLPGEIRTLLAEA